MEFENLPKAAQEAAAELMLIVEGGLEAAAKKAACDERPLALAVLLGAAQAIARRRGLEAARDFLREAAETYAASIRAFESAGGGRAG